jgi:hypothetical protein
MATIRALEREDLTAVSRLVRDNLPGWRRDAAFLERTLVDHPWAPATLPSLVAVDDSGRIVGSIGAQARRLVFDGAELGAISVSHLVVAPDRRAGAAGAMLVRKLLAGDQDLTWTDSGTETVARIWRTFGAHVDHARASNWMVVLKPGRWLAQVASLRIRSHENLRQAVPVAAFPLHAAGARLMPRSFSPPATLEVIGADASSAEVVELLPALTKGVRLRLDYDVGYLSSVSEQVSPTGFSVVQRVVRRGTTPIGWYAYVQHDGVGRVIHLAAASREAESVFGELEAHARSTGASVLCGRFEPNLQEPLHRRSAALGLAQRPLFHARDERLLSVLASGESLITEMDLIDSGWW